MKKGYYLIIRGPLGCGKSTISELLAKKIKARYIAIDHILEENDLRKDKEAGYVSQRSFKKANELSVPDAKKALSRGIPVIFDGNFYWESQIEDLVSRLDYPHKVFTLKAPLHVCIDRDSRRKKVHGKDAAGAVYKKSTSFEHGNLIDTENKSIDQTLKEIMNGLRGMK